MNPTLAWPTGGPYDGAMHMRATRAARRAVPPSLSLTMKWLGAAAESERKGRTGVEAGRANTSTTLLVLCSCHDRDDVQ